MNKIYFPGLNGIRFFAAYLVLVDHLELLKGYLGIPAFWGPSFSAHLGSLGVTVFFVLSGFLITYLLLSEKKVTQTVSIGDFYLRRILRIWPLYFLITFLGFFVIPQIPFLEIPTVSETLAENFWEKFALFMVLLANLAFVMYSSVPFANVLWSVGVEEQFYLIWPLIIRFVKQALWVLIGICVFFVLARFAVMKLTLWSGQNTGFGAWEILAKFIERTRFSCMAIGGLGAFSLFYEKKKILNLIFHPLAQVSTWLLFAFILLDLPRDPGFLGLIKFEVTSTVICVLILNIAANPARLFGLENKVFNFLGKISYGLYVFHLIALVITLKTISILWIPGENASLSILISWNVVVYLLGSALAIGLSAFSFRYFESWFLKKKHRFSKIVSGDDAR